MCWRSSMRILNVLMVGLNHYYIKLPAIARPWCVQWLINCRSTPSSMFRSRWRQSVFTGFYNWTGIHSHIKTSLMNAQTKRNHSAHRRWSVVRSRSTGNFSMKSVHTMKDWRFGDQKIWNCRYVYVHFLWIYFYLWAERDLNMNIIP